MNAFLGFENKDFGELGSLFKLSQSGAMAE
jgi:hypothetical protein